MAALASTTTEECDTLQQPDVIDLTVDDQEAVASKCSPAESDLRAELKGLKQRQLQKRAVQLGASPETVGVALDAADKKAALINLILKLKAPDLEAASAGCTGVTECADPAIQDGDRNGAATGKSPDIAPLGSDPLDTAVHIPEEIASLAHGTPPGLDQPDSAWTSLDKFLADDNVPAPPPPSSKGKGKAPPPQAAEPSSDLQPSDNVWNHDPWGAAAFGSGGQPPPSSKKATSSKAPPPNAAAMPQELTGQGDSKAGSGPKPPRHDPPPSDAIWNQDPWAAKASGPGLQPPPISKKAPPPSAAAMPQELTG